MDQHSGTGRPGGVVGARVRRLRDADGLSLAELSARAGVSKTTVHDIEQGGANPRLDTLYALATALGVGLADLLTAPDEGETGWVVRADDGPVVHGKTIAARLIGRIELSGHIEVYELSATGGVQQSTGHAGAVRECLIVHDGTVTTGPSHAPIELHPGDATLFSASDEHCYGSAASAGGRATLIMIHDQPQSGVSAAG